MCACAGPSARTTTVSTETEPAESSSGLIGGGTSRGGATRAPPPGMISAPRQLNSAPPAGPTSPGDHVGACAHVHQRGCRTGCGKVRKLRGRRAWAIVAVRTKAAPSAPLRSRARRVSHSPPRENLLSERPLRVNAGRAKALQCGPLVYASLPRPFAVGPALTTFVSRSSAGSQPRSRGPQQSRQTSARQR